MMRVDVAGRPDLNEFVGEKGEECDEHEQQTNSTQRTG
jgi:hypothetical protein